MHSDTLCECHLNPFANHLPNSRVRVSFKKSSEVEIHKWHVGHQALSVSLMVRYIEYELSILPPMYPTIGMTFEAAAFVSSLAFDNNRNAAYNPDNLLGILCKGIA